LTALILSVAAYSLGPYNGEKVLWIPRRSYNKRTSVLQSKSQIISSNKVSSRWPGKLDVTVGGGIGCKDTPLSTILRECTEEAMLDVDYVRNFVCPTGVLSFPNRSPHRWILPGIYYTFDLELPSFGPLVPQVNPEDGEVESFERMTVEEVVSRLFNDEFKSSSAMAMVDFLVRHGYVTAENDARYADLCFELRRDIGLPKWQPLAEAEGKSVR